MRHTAVRCRGCIDKDGPLSRPVPSPSEVLVRDVAGASSCKARMRVVCLVVLAVSLRPSFLGEVGMLRIAC
jgi:hypothetical protein